MASPSPPHQPVDRVRRGRWLLGSAFAAICVAGALVATSPGLPMAWDEGDAILRAEAIPGRWDYTTQREGHPALSGIVIAAGQRVSAGWLAPLDAARFGPMVLFAVAAGAMFYRIGRDYSAASAVAAVAALLLMPRVFAHAHFATLDGPLTSCWILAWATFAPAGRNASPVAHGLWRHAVPWGVLLGLTLSSKATGWIAPVPFVAWVLVYRDRSAAKTLAVGLPVAFLTFLLVNPPLWHDTLRGLSEFFSLNLHRADRSGLNIPVAFLGESYHLGHPLPWYNTLLWTAVTVPVGTLLLAAIGTLGVMRRCCTDRSGMLLVANWLVLLIVRALPIAPPHDGVRLFLPSFAFLAALAGVGAGRIIARASRPLVYAGLGLIYLGSASSLYWYAPQWLSYYNLLIGGLPGATAAGMEPTYYWDALDRTTLEWLHDHTAPGEKIFFSSPSPDNLALMQRWGTLDRGTQCDTKPPDTKPGNFRWYVLQRRPGPWPWHPVDPWLIEHCQPAYSMTIRRPELRTALLDRGRDVPWPWQLDVPLVEVYDYGDALRAQRATGGRSRQP